MKDIVKMVIILSLIAIVAGALLGGVYVMTKVDVNEQILKEMQEQFPEYTSIERFKSEEGINISVSEEISAKGTVKNTFKTNDNTLIFHSAGKGGYGGDVELLVAIKDNKIVKVVTYSSKETPGIGAAVLDGNYIKQFINVDITAFEKFVATKPKGGDIKKYFDGAQGEEGGEIKGSIDGNVIAVTGATRTSNAVLNSINVAVSTYSALKKGGQI